MRKSLIIPLFLITLGTAYGLVAGLYPDTTSFPRIPTGPGTIANSIAEMLGIGDLSTYVGDGAVTNSQKLGGISATGYLAHNTCSTPGEVWLGISDDGTPICGPKGSLLAVEIGTLTGVTGTVTITKMDGTSTAGTNGDTLYYGDLISTIGSSSGMIAFADASIIRLDTSTTVELSQTTNSSGSTIADVILSDGNLWGRVLTSTGLGVEAGGYIAGVRGTSISVQKSGPSVTFSIVDSTITGSTAATFRYKSGTGVSSVGSGTRISVSSGVIAPLVTNHIGKLALLTGSTWIANNTVADISYMLALQDQPAGLSESILSKLTQEFDVTVPSLEDTATCKAITGDASASNCTDDSDPGNVPTGMDSTSDPEIKQARKEMKAQNMLCREKHNGVFWPTIGKCVKPDTAGKNIIFAADFTDTAADQFSSTTSNGTANISPGATQFEDVPAIISPRLIEFKNTISQKTTALKGRTMAIAPALEQTFESVTGWPYGVIRDNGNFLASFNTNGKKEWTLNEIRSFQGYTTPNDNDITAPMGTTWDSIYIPAPNNGTRDSEYLDDNSPWKKWKYPSGIYLRKSIPNLATTSAGISISGNQYLSYPLSEFPGGASFLAGKTIEIELVNDPISPTGVNAKDLLNLGNLRIKMTANGWECTITGTSFTPTVCNTTINGKQLLIATIPKRYIINIPLNLTISKFIIGNGNSFGSAIGETIKSIRLY